MKKKIKPAEHSKELNRAETMQSIKAINGKRCEAAFIRSGRDPEHLARFLKKYPAAYYLSWVQAVIAEWGARGDFDNLKLLQPSRGQRKTDSGLLKVHTDFLIYSAVMRMIDQGYKLTANKEAGGIFHELQNTNFGGKHLSESQIKSRYYRFLNHKPATFIDNDKAMILGPTRFQISGFDLVGFWTYTPENGFKTLAK
jgi:hypothetical protein